MQTLLDFHLLYPVLGPKLSQYNKYAILDDNIILQHTVVPLGRTSLPSLIHTGDTLKSLSKMQDISTLVPGLVSTNTGSTESFKLISEIKLTKSIQLIQQYPGNDT